MTAISQTSTHATPAAIAPTAIAMAERIQTRRSVE